MVLYPVIYDSPKVLYADKHHGGQDLRKIRKGGKEWWSYQIANAYRKNISYWNTLYTAFVLCTSPTLEHPHHEEGKNTDNHCESRPMVSRTQYSGPYFKPDCGKSGFLRVSQSCNFSLQLLSLWNATNISCFRLTEVFTVYPLLYGPTFKARYNMSILCINSQLAWQGT